MDVSNVVRTELWVLHNLTALPYMVVACSVYSIWIVDISRKADAKRGVEVMIVKTPNSQK